MASWETAMRVDPISYATLGNYSEVSGAGEEAAIANLFGSLGLVEDAPTEGASEWNLFSRWFFGFF